MLITIYRNEDLFLMKQNVNIKKLTPDAIIPTYGTEYSAGADLYSGMTEAVTIKPAQLNSSKQVLP